MSTTTTPYGFLNIMTPTPGGDGGLFLNANFKLIVDTVNTTNTTVSSLNTVVTNLNTTVSTLNTNSIKRDGSVAMTGRLTLVDSAGGFPTDTEGFYANTGSCFNGTVVGLPVLCNADIYGFGKMTYMVYEFFNVANDIPFYAGSLNCASFVQTTTIGYSSSSIFTINSFDTGDANQIVMNLNGDGSFYFKSLGTGQNNVNIIEGGHSGANPSLGFFGATPVIKPTSTTDLRTALINLGLYTTGGATPLNLNGGALVAGTITSAGTVNSGVTTATTTAVSASTYTITPTAGNTWYLTIGTGATTLTLTITSGSSTIDGQRIQVFIKQNGTGSTTLSYAGSNVGFGTDITATTLTTGANKVDVIEFTWFNALTKWIVTNFKKGYN
jgi:ribosomal protein L27